MQTRRFLRAACALAFATALLAQAPVAPRSVATKPEVHGRLEEHQGLRVLHVWGTAKERGFAHGYLLGQDIAAIVRAEFVARFARKPQFLVLARNSLARLIAFPDDVREELDALWDGVVQSGADRRLGDLEREFDRDDLRVANALDVFGLMGCSGFTLCGAQVEGGGVLSGRNFDWPFTGPHLLDGTLLLVEHRGDGPAVASVTWPGYLGVVTGVNEDGLCAFLHVGTGNITWTPEPGSVPSAIALGAILAQCRARDGARCYARALELLGDTSPPAGYLTRLVLPAAPAGDVAFALFETDSRKAVRSTAPDCNVVTNHFLSRADGRAASKDSLERQKAIQKGIDGCLQTGDHAVSIAEAWTLLASVQRGGKRGFGTLHSLVFRPDPWCFELRLADSKPDGLVAAPASQSRRALPRGDVFPANGPWAPSWGSAK
jgi:hypothetical protein